MGYSFCEPCIMQNQFNLIQFNLIQFNLIQVNSLTDKSLYTPQVLIMQLKVDCCTACWLVVSYQQMSDFIPRNAYSIAGIYIKLSGIEMSCT